MAQMGPFETIGGRSSSDLPLSEALSMVDLTLHAPYSRAWVLLLISAQSDA